MHEPSEKEKTAILNEVEKDLPAEFQRVVDENYCELLEVIDGILA